MKSLVLKSFDNASHLYRKEGYFNISFKKRNTDHTLTNKTFTHSEDARAYTFGFMNGVSSSHTKLDPSLLAKYNQNIESLRSAYAKNVIFFEQGLSEGGKHTGTDYILSELEIPFPKSYCEVDLDTVVNLLSRSYQLSFLEEGKERVHSFVELKDTLGQMILRDCNTYSVEWTFKLLPSASYQLSLSDYELYVTSTDLNYAIAINIEHGLTDEVAEFLNESGVW
jgi:hypothetical protein